MIGMKVVMMINGMIKKVINYVNFAEGEKVLVRKYNKYFGDRLVFNDVCNIVKNTEKAVLFKINEEWEEDNINKGKQFWVPKACLYMLNSEKKVVYIKQWANITLAR